MDDLLLKENIVTGLLWEAEDMTCLGPPAQASFRGMIKANRKLVYRDDEGKLATGYCNKVSMLYEPFAIYIKKLFGDGIYFSHKDETITYLLVINRGRIVSGTDCFIARTLFEEVMRCPGKYEHLDVKPLTSVHLNTVIERCRSHQVLLKRRRRFITAIGVCVSAILLIILGVIVQFYLNG